MAEERCGSIVVGWVCGHFLGISVDEGVPDIWVVLFGGPVDKGYVEGGLDAAGVDELVV